MSLTPDGPPPPRTWAKRFPEAFARWNRVRPATIALAQQLQLPVENLMPPDAVRRLAWEPPADADVEGVDAFLAGRLVRPWQREHVVPLVTPLLVAGSSPRGGRSATSSRPTAAGASDATDSSTTLRAMACADSPCSSISSARLAWARNSCGMPMVCTGTLDARRPQRLGKAGSEAADHAAVLDRDDQRRSRGRGRRGRR